MSDCYKPLLSTITHTHTHNGTITHAEAGMYDGAPHIMAAAAAA